MLEASGLAAQARFGEEKRGGGVGVGQLKYCAPASNVQEAEGAAAKRHAVGNLAPEVTDQHASLGSMGNQVCVQSWRKYSTVPGFCFMQCTRVCSRNFSSPRLRSMSTIDTKRARGSPECSRCICLTSSQRNAFRGC